MYFITYMASFFANVNSQFHFFFSLFKSLVFRDRPPTPPSMAQLALLTNDREPYLSSIKKLVTNKGYILLLLSYGMNVGVFYAISTLLSSFIAKYFPVRFLSFLLSLQGSQREFQMASFFLSREKAQTFLHPVIKIVVIKKKDCF